MNGRTDISIHLRNGSLSGVLYQARGAETGVVLLDGVGAALLEVASLYDELAGYLQSSGITVLRAGYRQPRDLVTCTYDVLGVLDAAHTWGVDRAALIVWAFSDSNVLETAEGVVTDVATAAVARTIGGDRGPVQGIATIVSRPDVASGARLGHGELRLLRSVEGIIDAHETNAVAILHVREMEGRNLAIALGGDRDLRRVAAPLLSRLYIWSRQVLLGTAATRNVHSAGHEWGETPRAVFGGARAWLNEEWDALLERLAGRDPARAASARASLRTPEPVGDLSVFRQADRAWLYLDYQARVEWLQACAFVRASLTAAWGEATHPA